MISAGQGQRAALSCLNTNVEAEALEAAMSRTLGWTAQILRGRGRMKLQRMNFFDQMRCKCGHSQCSGHFSLTNGLALFAAWRLASANHQLQCVERADSATGTYRSRAFRARHSYV